MGLKLLLAGKKGNPAHTPSRHPREDVRDEGACQEGDAVKRRARAENEGRDAQLTLWIQDGATAHDVSLTPCARHSIRGGGAPPGPGTVVLVVLSVLAVRVAREVKALALVSRI